MNSTTHKVLIQNSRVIGVAFEKGTKATPNKYPELEVIESDYEICTLPMWQVLRAVPENLLLDW